MIIIIIVLLILSTFLQSTTSLYLGYTYENLSIFSTLYVLITLMIIKTHFENKKKYFFLLIFLGIIIDISYTGTFGLNSCLFIVCYYISVSFHSFFPYNCFTISVSNLLCVFIYHIISFLFLVLFKYDSYSITALLKILSHSILMTITYSNIIYWIMYFITKKYQLKPIK